MVQLSRYRHRKDAKLSLAQIRAAHRLYASGMSLRDLAQAGWERWGYAEHSIRASRDADGSDAE